MLAEGIGSGVGDDFFLCFEPGEAEGEGDSSSAGGGDGFFFFFAEALGDGLGDSLCVDFFFRCGVGVGVENIPLSLSPMDCAVIGSGAVREMRTAAVSHVRNNIERFDVVARPRFLSAPLY